MIQLRIFVILFISIIGIFKSQNLKLRIIDSENGDPIPNARIIDATMIMYSNDDGFILLPKTTKNIEVSALGFQTEKFSHFNKIVKLKPLYKEIDEVKIINIDIKKLFSDVLKNYEKRYYSKPSIYNILYKQKNSDDDILSFLLIADGKLWTESNTYNYKDAFNKRFDNFIQMEVDSVKYFKSTISENDFCKGQSLNRSKDFIGNLFFNYELARVNYYFKTKDAKYSGKIVNDSNNEQTIVFKINTSEIDVSGTITYQKIDKTIIHYELNYDQSKYPSYKVKNKNGLEYEFKVGNGVTYYDFYKKGDKYLPSLSGTKGYSYCTYDELKQKNSFSREIIFQKFSETNISELPNKIDLTKRIWENISKEKTQNNSVLLSEEEQKFIDEKSYEKD
ncbi:hypothetical protein SAMN05421796_101765 [Chryseobacterium piscicola]|uniref:CarboxypepD_reg-like domain-containing protein n=1 Tax=Chryseobacterium piscicola TaxID=551459 RepID=A0A1N7KR69_9FLAO|nr:carboxypeptidase-like regulatory domain-containing protein [Chryseobacterium piscicola]SIS64103.1 hypothetical protein SAMN05421796_101765 [Chryseobacterium piscicola]